MKGKIFLTLLVSAILLSTLVSAVSFNVDKSSILFMESYGSEQLTISNLNSSVLLDVSFTAPQIQDDEGNTLLLSFSPNPLTGINTSSAVTVNVISVDYSKLEVGKDYSGNLLIKNTADASDNKTVEVNFIKSFCKVGDIGGNLSITEVDIENDGQGDEDEWLPLDKIVIEVDVENENSDDDDKIDTVVEISLYDSDGEEYLDLDEVEIGKIEGGEEDTATFTFTVPADVGIDSGNYFLYVKAYEDGDEEEICTSRFDSEYFKEISIDREDDDDRQVLFDEIEVTPYPALCNEEVTLRAKVYNVGEGDQEEVKVTAYNKDLGLDLYGIVSDLDEGDGATVEFTFLIPKNASEGTYQIKLQTRYDYDDDYMPEDDYAYDDVSELDYAQIKVEGNCISPTTKDAEITASLETSQDDVTAGKEVIIRATIKNSGEERTTYTIALDRYELFSTVTDIDPATLTLDAGRSGDVLITLKLASDAEGDNEFDIKALFGSEEVKQAVTLGVSPSSGMFGITGLSIAESFRQNWIIWFVVLVNIILIIIIIVVAIKASR